MFCFSVFRMKLRDCHWVKTFSPLMQRCRPHPARARLPLKQDGLLGGKWVSKVLQHQIKPFKEHFWSLFSIWWGSWLFCIIPGLDFVLKKWQHFCNTAFEQGHTLVVRCGSCGNKKFCTVCLMWSNECLTWFFEFATSLPFGVPYRAQEEFICWFTIHLLSSVKGLFPSFLTEKFNYFFVTSC